MTTANLPAVRVPADLVVRHAAAVAVPASTEVETKPPTTSWHGTAARITGAAAGISAGGAGLAWLANAPIEAVAWTTIAAVLLANLALMAAADHDRTTNPSTTKSVRARDNASSRQRR